MHRWNKELLVVLVATSAMALSACAGLTAAKGKSGGPITLEVVFDRSSGARNIEQIDQLVEWMEPDLHHILESAGYVVVPQRDPAAFQGGPDRYLVLVHIVNYNAGSKAARMLVGWGAGALTLDTKNELYSAPGQLFFSSDGSVGSGRDWKNAARKINEQIARDFTKALSR